MKLSQSYRTDSEIFTLLHKLFKNNTYIEISILKLVLEKERKITNFQNYINFKHVSFKNIILYQLFLVTSNNIADLVPKSFRPFRWEIRKIYHL